MKGFLTKIAELDGISEVVLLSRRGEMLFCLRSGASRDDDRSSVNWQEVITGLENPATGDVLFAKGRYYLHHTDIGYLIVGMKTDASLNRVRLACSTVSSKLVDSSLSRQTLLRLLQEAEDDLKPHVIKELLHQPDRELARALLGLLRKRDQFAPSARERLLQCICQALGYCPAPEAIGPLQEIEKAGADYSQGVLQSARLAVLQLQKADIQISQPEAREPTTPGQSPATAPPPLQPRPTPAPSTAQAGSAATAGLDASPVATPEIQQIRELLQGGNKKEALALVLQTITTAARQKDFATAEKLRAWLMEIDPMALSEIIQSAEIIEEERKAAIDKDHLKIWNSLIEKIGIDSFSALYHSCTWQSWESGEILVSQGDLKPLLFFVNKGKVQLLMNCEGRSEPVCVVEPGSAFGAETFFEPSVWTVDAKSLSADLFMLSREAFAKLVEHHPALQDSLQSFTGKSLLSSSFFARTRKTRRRHERKEAHNRAAFVLIDGHEQETGNSTKGDLIDISTGGVAISFHASRKKAADSLLGQKVRIAIACHNAEPQVARIGIVRAIRVHDPIGNRYSLHAQFTQQLTSSELRRISIAPK